MATATKKRKEEVCP